jgi:hypothetical protein
MSMIIVRSVSCISHKNGLVIDCASHDIWGVIYV